MYIDIFIYIIKHIHTLTKISHMQKNIHIHIYEYIISLKGRLIKQKKQKIIIQPPPFFYFLPSMTLIGKICSNGKLQLQCIKFFSLQTLEITTNMLIGQYCLSKLHGLLADLFRHELQMGSCIFNLVSCCGKCFEKYLSTPVTDDEDFNIFMV